MQYQAVVFSIDESGREERFLVGSRSHSPGSAVRGLLEACEGQGRAGASRDASPVDPDPNDRLDRLRIPRRLA
jgi:hypothetical protein